MLHHFQPDLVLGEQLQGFVFSHCFLRVSPSSFCLELRQQAIGFNVQYRDAFTLREQIMRLNTMLF